MTASTAGPNGSSIGTPATTTALPTARLGALSSRISSVLSLSYADAGFDKALKTFDSQIDDKTVGGDGPIDLANLRYQFRQNVQQQVIEENKTIVRSFADVADQLRQVGVVVSEIKRLTEDARVRLDQSRAAIGLPLDNSRQLLDRLNSARQKQRLLQATRDHFTAPPPPSPVSRTTPFSGLGDDFFSRLDKLVEIHRDSQILLSGDDHRLGLDILTASSSELNSAYETLYSSTVAQWRTLDLDNPQMNVLVRRSLLALAAKPTLFKSCLSSYADVRSKVIADSFFAALTGSATDDSARTGFGRVDEPIDMYGHDPLRHTSDMLAWIHSAVVSEFEALSAIFTQSQPGMATNGTETPMADPWTMGDDGEAFDPHQSVRELVDRSLGGTAHLLRQRVDRTVGSGPDLVTVLKIRNLVAFYTDTFSKLVGVKRTTGQGAGSSMIGSFGALTDAIESRFHFGLKALVDKIPSVDEADVVAEIRSETSPPEFIRQIVGQVTQLLATAESSFSNNDTTAADFFAVLAETVVNPAVLAAGEIYAVDESDGSGSPDRTVGLLNALLAVRNGLTPHLAASDCVRELNLKISTVSSDLEQNQHAFLCHHSGLELLFDFADQATKPRADSSITGASVPTSGSAPMSPTSPIVMVEASSSKVTMHVPFDVLLSSPLLQSSTLASAAFRFDDFLSTALIDARDRITGLSDPGLARGVTDGAARRFCGRFARLEWMLGWVDDNSPADNDIVGRVPLRSTFPRTEEDVRVLLS